MNNTLREVKLPGVFDSKSVLAEHLYKKVVEFCEESAEKVTGMLIECSQEEIYDMLKDEDILQTRIHEALSSLEYLRKPSEDTNLNGESIAEKLFYVIEKEEPELASQITGMLLEMDKAVIERILETPQELRQAVLKAKSALTFSTVSKVEYNDEDIGNMLFEAVEELFPNEACKITGMLMEMDNSQVQLLLQDKTELQKKIQVAHNVLSTSSNLKDESYCDD